MFIECVGFTPYLQFMQCKKSWEFMSAKVKNGAKKPKRLLDFWFLHYPCLTYSHGSQIGDLETDDLRVTNS